MKLKHILLATAAPFLMNAQNVMTPEILWTLNKMSVSAVSPDQSSFVYKIGKVDLKTEKTNSKSYFLNLKNSTTDNLDLGEKSILQWDKNGLYAQEGEMIYLSKDGGKTWSDFYKIGGVDNIRISPDGKKVAFSKTVQLESILGKDKYEDTPKSTAQVYTDLDARHWDTWNEGKYNHIFTVNISEDVANAKDLMTGEKFDAPQKPFGGTEDFIWSPDSESLIYVSKKKTGINYALSTNTALYSYNLKSGKTSNLTEDNKGYDLNPSFSPDGEYLMWQSMERDGFEADKNRLKVMNLKTKNQSDLSKNWDESVTGSAFWSADSKSVYFNAAFRGTTQLFKTAINSPKIMQVTKGDFDVTGIIAQQGDQLFVTRTDFNHNADLFSVNSKSGDMMQITEVNKDNYAKLTPSRSELKMIKTTDGKEMGVWFIYPPNFDKTKKYPTLLYAQGGPQSALTQFFSTRWNFALMAASGYIIVAPNRRGMPGWGTEWNEAISKDWGGQPIKDYLSATDYAKTLAYVDSERIGAVGASYGGYSVFMLAGVHKNRFKTFISHDGLYDMKSWYGTTEELWFAKWDLGGAPWDKPTPKSYTEFNPSNYIQNWNKPIMIIQGGIDFRVGFEQGMEAFQSAKLRGLKTKFVYFPNENHWVLHPQNGLVWQREFFGWLKETL